MDKEIEALREGINEARVEEKILKANLITLNATMSTQDLRASVGALEVEKEELLNRLTKLRIGNITAVSLKDKDEVKQVWNTWSRNVRERKAICMNLWAYMTEQLPDGQIKEDLWVGSHDAMFRWQRLTSL